MSLIYCLGLVVSLAQTGACTTPISNASQCSIQFTKDTLALAKRNVAEGRAVLLDVRSQQEWDRGHIEGSILLPYDSLNRNPNQKTLAKKLPEKKILYTFCVSGRRATIAARKLGQLGYSVRILKPGIDAMLEAGFKKAKVKSVQNEAIHPRVQ